MKNNFGLSLVETLVSLLIITLIIGPFASMFIQSSRNQQNADRQLQAIYAARNKMEQLMAMSSKEFHAENGNTYIDRFYFRTSIVPYGINTDSSYFYFLFQKGEDLGGEFSIFSPDGKSQLFVNHPLEPITIEMNIENSYYHIQFKEHSLSGNIPLHVPPIILINMMDKAPDCYVGLEIMGESEVIIYSGDEKDWNISSNGVPNLFEGFYYRDYSLFKVKIEVYDSIKYEKPLVTMENIVRIKSK